MEVVYVYQKKRKDFGRQTLFSDRPAELTASIPPDPSYTKNYVERNPCHIEVQASSEKSEHEVRY
jgi:dynein intermediate chain 2